MADRLLHIIASNHWGGAQRYALDICRHYLKRDMMVSALTRDARVVDRRFEREGVALLHAPLRGFPDLDSLAVLARWLKRLAPDDRLIIHAHRYRDAFTAVMARRLAHRPDVRIVTTRHTVSRRRDSLLFSRLYNAIDAHIFVSQLALDNFRKHWSSRHVPIDPDRVWVLHDSLNIDSEPIVPEPDKGPVIALYQGAIVAGKGVEILIEALSMLRGLKLRLRIAGTGNPDYLDTLRSLAIRHGVMNMIDWHLKCNDPADVIPQTHFGVVPSIEREGFGMQNIEYMAAGRPHICTLTGGQMEYITPDVTALAVPPGDAKALAEAMRRLTTDAALRANMGAAARKAFYADLSWPRFTDQLDHIYFPDK